MKINSGKTISRKFTANSGPAINTGNRTAINMIMTITILNAITKYLNFNENAPIIRIIEERKYYVNEAGSSGDSNE